MQHNKEARLDMILSHLFPTNTASSGSLVESTAEDKQFNANNNNNLIFNSCSGSSVDNNNSDLSCAKCTAFSSSQFKDHMIDRYYTPEQAKIRNDIYDLVRDNPLFERKYGLSKEQERQLTHDRAVYIIQKLRPFELEHFKTDPKRFFTFLETLNNIDFGVAGRCMIHFGLCGGSILYFGTEKHQKFQDRMVNDFGKIFMMFCMSEIGHASNVQSVETQAIYDHPTQTIHIRTPTDSAVKVWSGGAAQFAQWAVVFAQLVIDNKTHGVHAFIVPIRSEKDHSILPGIRIRDLGSKIGLNCLDNGRVWFDIKIPKDYMLDKFGTIDSNGKYKTAIPDDSMRFLAHVQALLVGRIMTASSSLNALKMSLEITLKYAIHRRQFGPTTNGDELQIINYLSYQRRLYPYLAFSFVTHFSVEDLKTKYETNSDSKMIHTLASCLKAKCSDTSLLGCQECRKASGAQGFLSANRIGEMRDIADASVTYEGDNHVLYQTASRNLVRRNTKIPTLEKLTSLQDLLQLQQLFEFREATIEKQYREKLGKLSKTQFPFDAANKTQDLALKLGNAYIENNTIKVFLQEGLAKLSNRNKNLTEIFTRLALLLIYTWIQQDGFFLQHDLISKDQYSQLDESINSICHYLTPFIPTLVNSFGYPSFLTNVIMGPKLVENLSYDKIYN